MDDSQVKFILNEVEKAMPGRGVAAFLDYLYQENKKLHERIKNLEQQASLSLKTEQDYSTCEQEEFSRRK